MNSVWFAFYLIIFFWKLESWKTMHCMNTWASQLYCIKVYVALTISLAILQNDLINASQSCLEIAWLLMYVSFVHLQKYRGSTLSRLIFGGRLEIGCFWSNFEQQMKINQKSLGSETLDLSSPYIYNNCLCTKYLVSDTPK